MTVPQYLAYFDEMMRPTASMFRLVPADGIDWKPTDNSFSLGQLMAHIALSLGFYGRGIAYGDWGVKSMREIFVRNRHTPAFSFEEAVQLLEENYKEFKQRIGTISEDDFNNGVVDSPQLGRAPRWRLAMLAVEHTVNHRAEMFMYLKLLGVKVNTGTLYTKIS